MGEESTILTHDQGYINTIVLSKLIPLMMDSSALVFTREIISMAASVLCQSVALFVPDVPQVPATLHPSLLPTIDLGSGCICCRDIRQTLHPIRSPLMLNKCFRLKCFVKSPGMSKCIM
jgi:hypothetical protein